MLWYSQAVCGLFVDYRDPQRTEHSLKSLISQRVYGIALGYEDLNDHDSLRHDVVMGVLCEKSDPAGTDRACERDQGKAIAGKSTLNRLELTPEDANEKSRYKKIVAHGEQIDDLMVDVYIQAQSTAPEEVVLDIDATDDLIYGKQEGRFFHGYYRDYCYLPLYIFCGEYLLCARLRVASEDPASGVRQELERIVKKLRAAWAGVRIIVRGDSGFCREEIMSYCEHNATFSFTVPAMGNESALAAR